MTESPGAQEQAGVPRCSIERSLQVLGERWTFLILREIFTGNCRFAEIRNRLGIAPNLLSARLSTLVSAGVLVQRAYQEQGQRRRAGYHLTDAGTDLRVVLAALEQWGDEHLPCPSGPGVVRRSVTSGTAVHVGFIDEHQREVPGEDVVATPL